ncbi:MAG: DUF3887 domain-containing protein [Spirochaetes bacterium]|nr:DUF3887 domain-containing protein [Spirochaetota bacterium]
MKRYVLGLLTAALCIPIAVGCSRETEVTGRERAEMLAMAAPVADRLLSGFNRGDYPSFSKDFDEAMKQGLSDKVFVQTRDLLLSKIGRYRSRGAADVSREGPRIIVRYAADFEKERGVSVRLVFTKYPSGYLVSGLWFDSPKLRH